MKSVHSKDAIGLVAGVAACYWNASQGCSTGRIPGVVLMAMLGSINDFETFIRILRSRIRPLMGSRTKPAKIAKIL